MKFYKEHKRTPIRFCDQDLFIKEWSAKTREMFETEIDANKGSLRAFLIKLSLVDADGNFVVDDVADINELPWSVVNPAVELISTINNLNQKAIDDIEKK